MSFLFKNCSLVEVIYLLSRCNETKFFLLKHNTGRDGVNKENKYTPNTQRKTTLERVT